MRVLIISDAWSPQINGVVRSLQTTAGELTRLGHNIHIIGPDPTRPFSFAVPFYSEIKLEFFAHKRIARVLRAFEPDCIHIATEGPLGWAARSLCLRLNTPFTTSYHTRFPEYLAARVPHCVAPAVTQVAYAVLRRFHAPSAAVMVATARMERELHQRHFHRLVRWSRGVTMHVFAPHFRDDAIFPNMPRPILLCVGRVAIEKNLLAFLRLDIDGSKVVVGDGPHLAALRSEFPNALFMGPLHGEALARIYASSDLFVFPSRTDTFGLVLLEACASGLRIAAYPVPGPADIFSDKDSQRFAVLDPDLRTACTRALALPRDPFSPRAFAARFSWEACTRQFLAHLQTPSPKAVRRVARWRRKLGEGLITLRLAIRGWSKL